MGDVDVLRSLQVSYRTGHLEYPVKGSGRQVEPLGGGLQQTLGAVVQLTELPDLGGTHLGVAEKAAFLEPILLNPPRLFHPHPGSAGIFSRCVFHQLLVLHRRDFDENVDPVKQRTADALLITGHG